MGKLRPQDVPCPKDLQGAPGSDGDVGAVVPLLAAGLEDGTVVVVRMSLAGQCSAVWVEHGSL